MPIKTAMGLLLLILVIIFPLFTHLDALPIQQWDEARYATNALEMYNGHCWFINVYDGNPDMWATKPPLMIWLQVLSMWLLGISELTIRIPSAMAAAGTCLLMFFFFTKKYKEPWLGLISVAVLITTNGYVTPHATRTGDLDSLFTMLTTGYVLFYFLYLEESRRKYLYITFLLLTLAMLTKGIQAALFLPSLLVYTIYQKQLATILKTRDFYIGCALAAFIVLGFYLLREHYNPGYIAAVWENEVAGRYTTVIEEHRGGMWYYCGLVVNSLYHQWYLFLAPGFVIGYFSRQKWIKNVTACLFCVVLIYLVIISGAQTKLDWYLVPLYPFLSIVVAIFLFTVCNVLVSIDSWKKFMSFNPFPYIFLFLIFVVPYKDVMTRSLSRPEDIYTLREFKEMEQFLKDVLHHEHKIDNCAVLDDGYEMNRLWYYKVFEKEHIPVRRIGRNEIDPNGKLVAFRPYLRKYVQDNYYTQILEINDNVVVYKLNGKKTPPDFVSFR